MSGGHFNYQQHVLSDIADDIERLIKNNNVENEWGDKRNLPSDIIKKFKKGVMLLKQAEVYVHRIDWLVSGDDGEDSFRKNLQSDLKKIKEQA